MLRAAAGDSRGLRKALTAAATRAIPAVDIRDNSLRALVHELHRIAWEALDRIVLMAKSNPAYLGLHGNPDRSSNAHAASAGAT